MIPLSFRAGRCVSPGTKFALLAGAACLFVSVTAASAATGDPIHVTRGTQLTDAPWQPLARASSPRSKAAAFVRGFLQAPTAFAFRVTAATSQRVAVFWSVYCEGLQNDVVFTPQGSFKFRAPFVAYPPLLANASKCFVTVRATPTLPGKARVTVYGY